MLRKIRHTTYGHIRDAGQNCFRFAHTRTLFFIDGSVDTSALHIQADLQAEMRRLRDVILDGIPDEAKNAEASAIFQKDAARLAEHRTNAFLKLAPSVAGTAAGAGA